MYTSATDQLVLYSEGIAPKLVSGAIADVEVVASHARPSVPSLEDDRAALSISNEFSVA